MDDELACWRCNYFMCDKKDFETGYGVCMEESDVYEPFYDDIFEKSDFSSCIDTYNEKRFSGDRNVCEKYEEAEIYEIDDGAGPEEIMADILLFEKRTMNVESIKSQFYSEDREVKTKALKEIIDLIYFGNKMAYEALLNYFISSKPAASIEDVHTRIEIIEVLQYKTEQKVLVEPFVNELLKTPSNNTTRQIYTKIIKFFERCPRELVIDPLENYLKVSGCSYRLKERFLKIIENDEYYLF